jgi:DNA-binding transcriptional ArsR family regulator
MSGVRVKVSFEGCECEFSGDAEQVLRSLIKFISDVYPAFSLVKNLTLSLDLEEVSKGLRDLVAVHPEPTVLTDMKKLTIYEGCLLVLIVKYLAYLFGKSDKPSLSLEEVSGRLGKSKSSISARLSELQNSYLVEKVERGEYRVTSKGLKYFISEVAPKLRGERVE